MSWDQHPAVDCKLTSSWRRYVGLMVVRIAPMLAHAHCNVAYPLDMALGNFEYLGMKTDMITFYTPVVTHDHSYAISFHHPEV